MRRSGPAPLAAKIAFLRDPGSYAGDVRSVSAIETHFAWVFLTERHAYKLKKPLRHQAMDYRTLASRKRGCREELRLNRKLAREVYLAVVPLAVRGGRLALEKEGVVVEWLVKMRRLPSSGMLDRILAQRVLSAVEIERLVAMLARFFRGAQRSPMAAGRYVGRLAREVMENRRATRIACRRGGRGRSGAVMRLQRQFLERARSLVGARGARLVDGHGDLRAEHVCLAPPACVIDRLEFSRALRRLDPIEEIAFLSLEIERLGRPGLAAELVRRFCAATGDPVAPAIVSFYRSHRAANRAKLAAWHLGDRQFPDARPWIARANSYLRDAERHARDALRLLGGERSARIGGRPALEQRGDRRPARHARNRRAEKRRN